MLYSSTHATYIHQLGMNSATFIRDGDVSEPGLSKFPPVLVSIYLFKKYVTRSDENFWYLTELLQERNI